MTAIASPRARLSSQVGLRLIVVGIALVPVVALGVPSEIPTESRVLASRAAAPLPAVTDTARKEPR